MRIQHRRSPCVRYAQRSKHTFCATAESISEIQVVRNGTGKCSKFLLPVHAEEYLDQHRPWQSPPLSFYPFEPNGYTIGISNSSGPPLPYLSSSLRRWHTSRA